MNNESTIEKMNAMKLHGMAKAFSSSLEGAQHEFTIDQLVAHLVETEWEWRQNNKFNRLLQYAKFRYQASFEQINFRLKRNLNKNAVLRFQDCGWLRKRQNIIITGSTGSGKSFIASALGHNACMFGYRVLYFSSAKLFSTLKLKKADGSYSRELKRIQKQELLILDDFGLEHLDKNARLTLLELLEDRHGIKSTIIVSQMPVKTWHEIIGDATLADAICDRIIHSSHRIELKGVDSLRKKYKEDLT